MREILEQLFDAETEWDFKKGRLIIGDNYIETYNDTLNIVTKTSATFIKEDSITSVYCDSYYLNIYVSNSTHIRLTLTV